MATGSPFLPSTQLRSHCSSCGQTRPQTAGSALVCLDRADRGGKVARGDAADEAGDVDAHRAAVDAARLLAGQAARGLLAGELGRVAQGHLVEVAHALDRLLLGHRPSHQVDLAHRPTSSLALPLARDSTGHQKCEAQPLRWRGSTSSA